MADDADRAQADIEKMEEELSRKPRYEMPAGEAGECARCGEVKPRLVNGCCARCRDEYGLP